MRFLFVILFSAAISTAAYADCGSFDQLVAQTHAITQTLGSLNHPDCSQKPEESILDNLIGCFTAGLPSETIRVQAQADLHISALYDAIMQCYSSGVDRGGPGKKSYEALVSATQTDPTYQTAWMAFGETLWDMSQRNFFERAAIEITLGISIDDEIQSAIQGLSSLPQNSTVSAEIAKLKAE